MTSVRVVPNQAGIDALLRSDNVVDVIRDRTEKMASAARGRNVLIEGEPGDVLAPIETAVTIQDGAARGVVYVPHAAGLALEAKHRLLGGAIDAAR